MRRTECGFCTDGLVERTSLFTGYKSMVPCPYCHEDREPQPGDGPHYHADHAAWVQRQGGEVTDA